MSRRLIRYLSLIVMLMTARPLHADPRWSRLDTPNFIILGQGDSSLREVGRQFEGFREALTRVLSATVTATPVPTIVVAFPDEKSFLPFEPVFEGKAVEVGGLSSYPIARQLHSARTEPQRRQSAGGVPRGTRIS